MPALDRFEYPGRAKTFTDGVRARPYPVVERKYVADGQFNKEREEAMVYGNKNSRLNQHLESYPNARCIREKGASYDV